MNITALRSDRIYQELIDAPMEIKVNRYRERMLAPFRDKWDMQQIPFEAHEPHGFDVLTLHDMMNLSPLAITKEIEPSLAFISNDVFWETCVQAVTDSLDVFTTDGLELPVTNYLFTMLLGNPDSPTLRLNEGYCGDGGIPGYILGTILPDAYTLPRVPSLLAHEINHNVRYQYVKWTPQVTLGEMLVSEGLAESFATMRYGEQYLGPWVAKTSMETLQGRIKPAIKDRLSLTGWDKIAPYLYGDETAKMQGLTPVDMPYGAGYALGYDLIQYFLKTTGMSIAQATITPAEEILTKVEGYWNETELFYR